MLVLTHSFNTTCSSQQTFSSRSHTTTEYRTGYEATKQARNTVADTRGGRRLEAGVYSEYYPGRSRAKMVNVDEDRQGGYMGREEPQVKVRVYRCHVPTRFAHNS